MSNAVAPTKFSFSAWRHGGWYVHDVRYPSGACGCVSRNYADGKWRIVCGRPYSETFPTRDAAARAEFAIAAAEHAAIAADAAEDDGCPVNDPDCMGNNGDCHDACEAPDDTYASADAASVELVTAGFTASPVWGAMWDHADGRRATVERNSKGRFHVRHILAPAPVAMVAQPVQQQQAKAGESAILRSMRDRLAGYEAESSNFLRHSCSAMAYFEGLAERLRVEIAERIELEKAAETQSADKPEAWEAQARAAGWIQLIGGAWAAPGSAIVADRRLVKRDGAAPEAVAVEPEAAAKAESIGVDAFRAEILWRALWRDMEALAAEYDEPHYARRMKDVIESEGVTLSNLLRDVRAIGECVKAETLEEMLDEYSFINR